MIKRYLCILSAFLLVSCAEIAQTYVETTDKLGLTPQYEKDIRHSQSTTAKYHIPINKAPEGMPDGEFEVQDSKGRTLKTFVKNGIFDKYGDVYYPNGQLHSHTPLVNGIAHGWSQGYTENGKLRTKILYHNGSAIRWILYDENGNIVKEQKR